MGTRFFLVHLKDTQGEQFLLVNGQAFWYGKWGEDHGRDIVTGELDFTIEQVVESIKLRHVPSATKIVSSGWYTYEPTHVDTSLLLPGSYAARAAHIFFDVSRRMGYLTQID